MWKPYEHEHAILSMPACWMCIFCCNFSSPKQSSLSVMQIGRRSVIDVNNFMLGGLEKGRLMKELK